MTTHKTTKPFLVLVVLAAALFGSFTARATSESNCSFLSAEAIALLTEAFQDDPDNFELFLEFFLGTCDGNAVANREQLRGSVQGNSGIVGNIVGGALLSGFGRTGDSQTLHVPGGGVMRSQSAGDGFGYPFGLWAGYTHNSYEDEFALTRTDADGDNILVGVDFTPYDGYLFGVALGYEQTDVETRFNAGEVDYQSLTIIPYMGANLSDALGASFDVTMDLSIGFSSVEIDQFRTNGAGARVTSETNSDRLFFSGNVNVGQYFGDVYLSGRAGILMARDEAEGFTESDGTVVPASEASFGRATIGGGASYLWGKFEPFANAYLQHDYDFDKNPLPGAANDATDVRVGLGLRFYANDSWSGGVEYNRTLGRDDFEEQAINLSIRGDF